MTRSSRVTAAAACALLGYALASVVACSSTGGDEPLATDASARDADGSPPKSVITDPPPPPDGDSGVASGIDAGADADADASLTLAAFDLVVYGGTPSGIAAAVEAGRLGKKVAVVEASPWIGGMMSGGLSATDIGTATSVGGIAAELLALIHAREVDAGAAGSASYWAFEPHVAAATFASLLSAAGVTVFTRAPLASVIKTGTTITAITTESGLELAATVFIDASYEGDLMVQAGVAHASGRESAAQYGEPNAGVQAPSRILVHDLPDGGVVPFPIDPYLSPGEPDSGLLFEVSPGPAAAVGSADKNVQAYNYRLCATDVATHGDNVVSFAAQVPAGYDPQRYEGVVRYLTELQAFHPAETAAQLGSHFLNVNGTLPAGKIDVNGGTAFSTDVVLVPAGYPEGDAATRAQIAGTIESYIRGLYYFLQTSSRIPASIRAYIAAYGLCKDEFTDNDNWPTQLYIREGRRMVGAYVMTELNVVGKATVADPIGLGNYNMDSHIVQLLAIDGDVWQEGEVSVDYSAFGSVAGTPYGISYRALTPKPSEATNLLVSVTMSASRMADRSLRVEPTYMIMGQAAGAAASLAIDAKVTVQDVDYTALRAQLVTDKQVFATK